MKARSRELSSTTLRLRRARRAVRLLRAIEGYVLVDEEWRLMQLREWESVESMYSRVRVKEV